MKKALSLLLAIMMIVSVGCSPATTTEPSTSTDSSTDGPEAITLEVCVTEDSSAWLDSVIAKYAEVAPHITVEPVILSGSSSDNQSKMTMMMQSPETCPDIMKVDGFKINADAAAGYLTPLDDKIAEWEDWGNFYGNVQEMGRAVDGNIYAVPMTVDVLGLWYSIPLLTEAGVEMPFEPETWDDVLQAAIKIKELGNEDVVPYFITTAKTFPERASMRLFQPLYNGTGNSIYDSQSGKWTIDEQAFMDVANYVDTVCNVEDLAPPLELGVQNQVETIIQQDMMKAQEVGIWLSGNWMSRNWKEGAEYAWDNVTEEVGFTKIPTQDGQDPYFTSMSGGWTLTIPENAQYKDEAWDFLKFASSKENYLEMALMTGELTVRKDVAEDTSYSDASRIYIKEASEMLEYTEFRPSIESYPQVSLLFTEAMEAIGLGASTPEQVWETFAAALERTVGADNMQLS